MAAQAKPKFSEIHTSLWSYIHSRTVIGQDVIDSVEEVIASTRGAQKSYLTALLYAAKNDYDSAISFFQDAADSEDSTFALNYLAYLGASAHNYFHRMEIFRLEQRFCLPTMRRVARNTAYCIGNVRLIRSYTLKLTALSSDEDRQQLKDEGEGMIAIVENFKKASTLTSSQIEELCDEAEAIANKHGVNCIGAHYFIGGDSDNAYVIRAETEDSEILAELNLELLCLLTTDKYRSLPFTSWFRSDVESLESRRGS